MEVANLNYLNCKYKGKIRKIYSKSFPNDEKISFWILKKSLKSKNVKLNGVIYDNKIIGMDYILSCENDAYLMYLAIDESIRNKGYGTLALKKIINEYENVILSVEVVKDQLSKRRKDFYLRNGFYETGKYSIQNNVKYEILCSNQHYNLTKDKLINLYKQMTNSKVLKNLIDKKFNLFNIELTEK